MPERGLSLYEYRESQGLDGRYSFYALVAAAMRQADTDNMVRLTQAFPQVAKDLLARYNAPGGALAGEVPSKG